MWTHIIIGMMACLLLAKKVQKPLDLGFLGTQTTLIGKNAVEWCKNGLVCDVHSIIFGNISDLIAKWDINIEALHLELEQQVFLILDLNKDRPILVYQKSSIAALYAFIAGENAESRIEKVRDVEHDLDDAGKPIVIGQRMDFVQAREVEFTRGDGKFAKYELKY